MSSSLREAVLAFLPSFRVTGWKRPSLSNHASGATTGGSATRETWDPEGPQPVVDVRLDRPPAAGILDAFRVCRALHAALSTTRHQTFMGMTGPTRRRNSAVATRMPCFSAETAKRISPSTRPVDVTTSSEVPRTTGLDAVKAVVSEDAARGGVRQAPDDLGVLGDVRRLEVDAVAVGQEGGTFDEEGIGLQRQETRPGSSPSAHWTQAGSEGKRKSDGEFEEVGGLLLLDQGHRLAELDRLAVLDEDVPHDAAHLGLDLVHDLHGLDDAEHLFRADLVADVDEGVGIGLGRAVEGADERRLEFR